MSRRGGAPARGLLKRRPRSWRLASEGFCSGRGAAGGGGRAGRSRAGGGSWSGRGGSPPRTESAAGSGGRLAVSPPGRAAAHGSVRLPALERVRGGALARIPAAGGRRRRKRGAWLKGRRQTRGGDQGGAPSAALAGHADTARRQAGRRGSSGQGLPGSLALAIESSWGVSSPSLPAQGLPPQGVAATAPTHSPATHRPFQASQRLGRGILGKRGCFGLSFPSLPLGGGQGRREGARSRADPPPHLCARLRRWEPLQRQREPASGREPPPRGSSDPPTLSGKSRTRLAAVSPQALAGSSTSQLARPLAFSPRPRGGAGATPLRYFEMGAHVCVGLSGWVGACV